MSKLRGQVNEQVLDLKDTVLVLESETVDKAHRISELRDALNEIYAARGEDELISRIVNKALMNNDS